ncbi:MAG: metallophosphoesterase [Pseudomonadota bacterium]
MTLSRRQFLAAAGTASAGVLLATPAVAGIPSRIEHHGLSVRHPDLHGLCLAHLTDLHLDSDLAYQRLPQAVRLVNSRRPDLVLLTGDYVSWGEDHIEPFTEIAAGFHCPVVAVLGNHDHYAGAERMTAALSSRGVRVLSNTSHVVEIGGAHLRIVGIDDLRTQHADVAAALAGLEARDDLRIVLTHVPTVADLLPASTADLILAGHTHGGQIAIQGLTEWIVRAVGSPYARGFYSLPAGRLYVNRGWGTVGLPLRVGAPAEIAFFHCVHESARPSPV